MSTIHTDAAGNKYLGDCRWGNHDINYPTTNWLTSGVTRSVMSSTFDNYLAATGLRYRNPPGNRWTTSNDFVFCFGPINNNTIDDRYLFRYQNLNSSSATLISTARLFGDSGYTGTTNANSTTNQLASTSRISAIDNFHASRYECEFSAVSNGSSLAIAVFQSEKAQERTMFSVLFAGSLLDVNPNFNYYNSSIITSSFLHLRHWDGAAPSQASFGKHYIAGAEKDVLQSVISAAGYPISCSDGQTPGAQWATDMWVYDNNSTLGFPVIGRVPNMLLGVGTYTLLNPVKIQGSVFPDGGSPWYIPLGDFSGKTVLMRCHSSMN